jgi:hypothetical protein
MFLFFIADGSVEDSDAVVSGEESATGSGVLTPVSDLVAVTRRAAADLGADETVQLGSGVRAGTYKGKRVGWVGGLVPDPDHGSGIRNNFGGSRIQDPDPAA